MEVECQSFMCLTACRNCGIRYGIRNGDISLDEKHGLYSASRHSFLELKHENLGIFMVSFRRTCGQLFLGIVLPLSLKTGSISILLILPRSVSTTFAATCIAFSQEIVMS